MNKNDELFELTTKMYGEFMEFRKEVKQELKEVNSKLDTKADKRDLENLYDGYITTTSKS